ncbi:MAG: hypothetical protein U1D67_04185 [Dehalococcoidia bacterium]|nr:hypothetical protein [Dehalococcoidia bacterium]MDZ4246301.1 hypothetical protein [Dehalococcoidia bacterium]
MTFTITTVIIVIEITPFVNMELKRIIKYTSGTRFTWDNLNWFSVISGGTIAKRYMNMIQRYRHTQVGYVVITAVAAALIIIAISFFMEGNGEDTAEAAPVLIIVAVFLVAALVLFSSLTVTIGQEEMEVRFGPGPIRRRFKLRDIESCRSVRNHWFYGWGIRLTPHGWLFNVSGLSAVEINMKTGNKFRIGTNDPSGLETALLQGIKKP